MVPWLGVVEPRGTLYLSKVQFLHLLGVWGQASVLSLPAMNVVVVLFQLQESLKSLGLPWGWDWKWVKQDLLNGLEIRGRTRQHKRVHFLMRSLGLWGCRLNTRQQCSRIFQQLVGVHFTGCTLIFRENSLNCVPRSTLLICPVCSPALSGVGVYPKTPGSGTNPTYTCFLTQVNQT